MNIIKNGARLLVQASIAALVFTSMAWAQPPNEEMNRRADEPGTGAWPAMKEEVASLPAHVIYRPQNLSALGNQKLGVVAWGNGGCSDDGASSRFHLLELASHGYLVIANGGIFSGPGARQAPARETVAEGQMPAARTTAEQLTQAIDWALAENARNGSPYFGRISPDQIAVSGFSCGGIQTLAVAADPRIDTLVLMNTGIFNDAPPANIPGMDLTKAALADIHTSAIYILGGDTDIAYANGMDDYARIDHVPVAVANLLGVGHGGSYSEPNGGKAARVALMWLQWQLRGDSKAASWFTGANCALCTDPAWSYEAKDL